MREEIIKIPEKKTCILLYTATRQIACTRNSTRFRGDTGMGAGARSAVNGIAAAEMGRQDGRTGTTRVSQSTG